MAGNEVRIRATVDDKVSGQLGRIRDKFDTMGKSAATASLVGNLGAKAIGVGVGIAASAVGGLVSAWDDAVEAALAEEDSIAKLNASLAANTKTQGANLDVIEKTIKSRMRLGFADDEQRDSLARLVAITKDSAKALDLQRTAMDLARLRNIDLSAASDIVGKVFGGNIGILSRYGIQLKKGTSAQEALIEVQKLAAGQAEALAETNRGKLLAAQIQVDEAMEEFGRVTMPLVAEAARVVVKALDRTSISFADVEEAARNGSVAAGAHLNHLREEAEENGQQTAFAIRDMERPFKHLAEVADDETDKVAESFEDMVDRLTDETGRLIDEVHDPAIQYAEFRAAKEEEAALQRVITSKNSTKEEIKDARRRKREVAKEADELRLKLLESGSLTVEDTDEWLSELQREYSRATGSAKTKIAQLIAKIKELRAAAAKGINIQVYGMPGSGIGSGGGGRAAGGPVDPNKVYMVGEKGPELFVSDTAGNIIPNDMLSGKSGGWTGGGGRLEVTVNVTSAGVLSPAHGQAIAREVGPYLRDYLNRRG